MDCFERYRVLAPRHGIALLPERWEKVVENGGNYFDKIFIFPSKQIYFGDEKTVGIKFNT